jgi:hypothetical protein
MPGQRTVVIISVVSGWVRQEAELLFYALFTSQSVAQELS